MTFDVPDLSTAAFPGQARLFSTDLAILSLAASLSGVKSGCLVSAQGSPNMTLAVASGIIYWLNAEVVVGAGNVTITAANATNDRIDLVVANSSGVKSVVAGTPAAIPVEPALPALSIALAQVYVPANDTAIGPTQVKDRRIIVTIPAVAGASTLVRKTADESVVSSTALQDDDHLFFAMAPNTGYQVKAVLLGQSAAGTAMSIGFSVPAGGIWRMGMSTVGVTSTFSSDGNSGPFSTAGLPATGANTILFEGVVSAAGTAGNFRVRWAQNVSSATALKVLLNSYLEYRPLP